MTNHIYPMWAGHWADRYPRFFDWNLGNPSAPVTQEIFDNCIKPFLPLEQVNAIGFHTLTRSQHLPDLTDAESSVCLFVFRILGADSCEGWCGYTCAGATLANLHVVWLAREEAQLLNVPLRIFTSKAAHYSLQKAIRICGIPETSVRDHAELQSTQALNGSLALVWLTFGDTHTGAFEAPNGNVSLARRSAVKVRCHLDAAYGGLLAPMDGIPNIHTEYLDSVVVDFHKTGRLPLTRSTHLIRSDWITIYPKNLNKITIQPN